MSHTSRLFVIGLLSATLVGLEMIWTRLFSAEFYYTFAFLVLSLAVMGLGLGALAARLLDIPGRRGSPGWALALTGLACLAGPPLVFRLGLDLSTLFAGPVMAWRLALAILLLGAGFFFGGVALATIFRQGHRRMPRLYMADLLGAGSGVVLAVALMNGAGTPPAAFLCSLPVLLAAFLASSGWRKLAPALLALAVVPLCLHAAALLELPREERGPVVHRHWDAMSKIKVYDYEGQYRSVNIDNIANTGIFAFDGNWDRPEEERFPFGIDVSWLIERSDGCVFLSLGSGAGQDVLQALQAGATEIHAVEVISYINRMLLDGELAEFTGHFYRDPRVIVATEDARAYAARHEGKFDLIYSLSSNTFAALASGSFALAENYLFTTEAFGDYWEALSDDGYMMMEHQFYMPRLVASLVDALDAAGVEQPRSHFAVYDLPQMRRKMILLSRQPLTGEVRNLAFGELTEEKFEAIHLLYPAPEGLERNLINRIVLEGWQAVAADAPVAVSPTTDNRPFVGQMGLWRNLNRERLEKIQPLEVFGFPVSGILIAMILAVVLCLVVPLNLLPYAIVGPKLKGVPWLYFFTIGAAFMMVEIVLIQKYTLFVGPSVYSIAVILFTLLIASGIGSRFSERFGARFAFAGIVVWLLIDVLVFRRLFYVLGDLGLYPRLTITALLVAPLGFFMGMPFPKGAMRVGELVDWGFAVNGAASVLGATVVLPIAFSWGFSVALLAAAALYLLAFALLAWRSRWREAGQIPD